MSDPFQNLARVDMRSAHTEPYPSEPTPLVREIPEGNPYPLEALGPLKDAAEAIHDITQAPAAIGAQSVLGVASLAAQAIGDAQTLHGSAPASLFLLTVAQSGERKSACDRLAMKAVREFERELADEYREERTAYRNRLDIWQECRKNILKKMKEDRIGAQADLDALGPEPVEPLRPTIVASEPTLEGVTKNMPILRPSLGMFSDEGGAFVGGHGMNSENRLKTAAGFSGFWDGATVNRWRAGDGASSLSGRRLSSHLMVQPIAASQFLSDPIANQQGLLARFLITAPKSAIGRRLRIAEHSASSDRALERFAERIGSMLRRDLPLANGCRNELELKPIPLSIEARTVLQTFALQVEKEQTERGEFGEVRPFASKAAEQAARIAAVMSAYENPDNPQLSGKTMADAVTLEGFYLQEARRLADEAVISEQTREAEKLKKWLCETWEEEFISATDAAQYGPNSLRETEKVKKVLATLEKHGWVMPQAGGATVRGKKRREAWRIVRRAV